MSQGPFRCRPTRTVLLLLLIGLTVGAIVLLTAGRSDSRGSFAGSRKTILSESTRVASGADRGVLARKASVSREPHLGWKSTCQLSLVPEHFWSDAERNARAHKRPSPGHLRIKGILEQSGEPGRYLSLSLPVAAWFSTFDPHPQRDNLRAFWTLEAFTLFPSQSCGMGAAVDRGMKLFIPGHMIFQNLGFQFVSSLKDPSAKIQLSTADLKALHYISGTNEDLYRMMRRYEQDYQCQQRTIHPKVILLSDSAECQQALEKNSSPRSNELWFAKLANRHMGLGLRVWEGQNLKKSLAEKGCPQNSVATRYVQPVFTIQQRKWHLRQFIVVASLKPLVAFLAHSIVFFSAVTYDPKNISFLPIHVTNGHMWREFNNSCQSCHLHPGYHTVVMEELQRKMSEEEAAHTMKIIEHNHAQAILQLLHSLKHMGEVENWIDKDHRQAKSARMSVFRIGMDMNLLDDSYRWSIYDTCTACGMADAVHEDRVPKGQRYAYYTGTLETFHAAAEVFARKERNMSLANLETPAMFETLKLLVNEDDNRLRCDGKDCQGRSVYGECS